jgi:hypothetical protein
VLLDGDVDLAHFEAKDWGKRPVKVRVEDAGADRSVALLVGCLLAKFAADEAAAAASAGIASGGAVAGSS